MARRRRRRHRHELTEHGPPAPPAQETAITVGVTSTRISPVLAWILLEGILCVPLFLSYQTWLELIEVRSWIATPCTIVSSVVHVAWKKNEITYAYDFQGRHYQSARYYFDVVPGAPAVRAHPAGQPSNCYVNPADPQEAVLVNTIPDEVSYLWLILLFPLGGVLLLVAAVGTVVYAVKAKLRSARFGDFHGPTILKPRMGGPVQEVALYAVLCLLFDAMVGGLWFLEIYPLWVGKGGGTEVVFFIVILVPFSSLGIIGTFILGRKVLALFNPWPTLELTPGRISLGAAVRLKWQFTGRTESLRSLQILLSGTEQVIQVLGREAYTNKRVFHRTVLFHSFAPDQMSAGERQFVFPTTTMHSFESDHFSIRWSIDVRAEVAWLPRIVTHFPLSVRPHEQNLA
jgi:hypothetical protein